MTLASLTAFFRDKKLLKQCALGEVLFSGPQYQVEVKDAASANPYWAFIKLNPEGGIQDAFCSCESGDEGCIHRAFAYLAIQDASHQFFHTRFEHSFWRALCWVWFKRFGEGKKIKRSTTKLSLPGWELSWSSDEEKKLLLDILDKPPPTEENSMQLSTLSETELEEWEAGKATDALRFELSFWGDLAKHLFFLQGLRVSFQGKALPDKLWIEGEQLKIESKVEEAEWEGLVKPLAGVESSLKVYAGLKDLVKGIDFDKDKVCFHLHLKKQPKSFEKALKVGEWLFSKDEGFYPASTEKQEISGEAIAPFLHHHAHEINEFFKEPLLFFEPEKTKVQLSFDKGWNLCIVPYLFEQGDLKDSMQYDRWTYLPKKGFHIISSESEVRTKQCIQHEDVSGFVSTHSAWLSQFPGFKVHLGGLEANFGYNVDDRGSLRFERRQAQPTGVLTHEFGQWIYLEKEGFYNRTESHSHLQLPFGEVLRADQVASFVRRNRAELELIPGFFMAEPLFSKGGLDVEWLGEEKIRVFPHYEVADPFKEVKLRYYEEWVYAQGKGFYEMPSTLRVPEKYREPVTIQKEGIKEFLEVELKAIEPWIQHIDPRLKTPLVFKLELLEIAPGPLHSWSLHLNFRTERGKIEVEDILKALKMKKFYLFSPEGCIPLFKDKLLWLRRIHPNSILEGGRLLFSTAELLRLHAFEEMSVSKEASELFYDVVELRKVPSPDFSLLKCSLRPYQEKGATWLHALFHYQLGGLLCDEMGLGKTHQAMALMASVKQESPKAKFLVVCPTSVLYHWEDKLRDFLPKLKVLTFHGPFRKMDLDRPYDLLLTSYGILRNEGAWFDENKFDVVVFDEVQAAKNHRSKLYAALEAVKGNVKVGLTGTPIENRLRELKTLFDLVLPGYMPHESDYRRCIVQPIERDGNAEQKGLLHRMTKPFVYRRLKKDVMSDLPAKTEEIAHCDLLPTQERLYRETLLERRDELMKDLLDNSKAVPYLHVFSLLSRLKQICDHPALYFKTPADYKAHESGKWELFKELLSEARESGQKVVVYSQYLGMLDIIENYLNEESVKFASLRGSTRDRREQVEKFANDPACEVFVASLKAAGLGIDLTKASVVIHYDRWWNAARENQATDRVHRFGQNRGVQVFKLVTKNSFEERIDQIIERKKALLEQMVSVDDQDVLKSFTREEIYELLRMQT